jgi:hypothetical protein
MHFGGRLENQFAAASSREMMRVASSPRLRLWWLRVTHDEFARIGVAVVFWRRCGLVVGGPCHEL